MNVKMSEKTRIVRGMVQSDVRLNGKTVLITGANSGIGFETAMDMAGRGARVIMACRNLEKAEEAKVKILEEHKEADVVVGKLDLASLKSVREFVKSILENEDRLDILINNAGIMMSPQWKTEDGFEMQFGTNHIGHFLLTQLLLDLMKKSAPSRIINVSSLMHKFGKINWEDIMFEKSYDAVGAYCQSKLCNIHHCLELSRRLEGTGVTCYCLDPGAIETNLQQHVKRSTGHLFWKWKVFLTCVLYPYVLLTLVTPKQGAQTSVYCAIAPELADVTGKYFVSCKEECLKEYARNEEDAARLWKISEELIKDKM